MTKVTVLLPTYQSGKYLKETIQSVLCQTFSDFELLVIDDASTDNTLEILHSFQDSRIRVMQGPCKGLAEALNKGMQYAKGEYIARIDADDMMTPQRLEKQIVYMDTHLSVAVCGGWQQYFGLSTFLHAPPESPQQCRANLLFRCDLCHSTLMLRKDVFLQNNLFYNSDYAAEDFELWTRVLDFGEIANLSEILGYYREDGESITSQKKEVLNSQQSKIIAATLSRNLQMELSRQQQAYFEEDNSFFKKKGKISPKERKEAWMDLQELLTRIYCTNQKIQYYDEECLLRALDAEWGVLRYHIPFILPVRRITLQTLFRKRSYFEVIYIKIKNFCKNYRGIRRKCKRLCKTLR